LAFLVALLGYLGIDSFFEWLTGQANYALQEQYSGLAEQSIKQSLHQAQGGLLTSVSIIALWSVSGGIRWLMKALNTVHGVRESRPGWRRAILQLFFALGLAPTLIFAGALLLIGPRVIEWIAGLVGLDEVFIVLWAWLRLPVALVLLVLAVSVVYWVVPDVAQPYRLITPGAVLAVIVWLLASLGFSFYVSHFADYSVVYGGLATAIVLLLYFYISAAVLLMGAEVNAALYRSTPGEESKETGR
jgi:membrane protein